MKKANRRKASYIATDATSAPSAHKTLCIVYTPLLQQSSVTTSHRSAYISCAAMLDALTEKSRALAGADSPPDLQIRADAVNSGVVLVELLKGKAKVFRAIEDAEADLSGDDGVVADAAIFDGEGIRCTEIQESVPVSSVQTYSVLRFRVHVVRVGSSLLVSSWRSRCCRSRRCAVCRCRSRRLSGVAGGCLRCCLRLRRSEGKVAFDRLVDLRVLELGPVDVDACGRRSRSGCLDSGGRGRGGCRRPCGLG